MIAIKLTNLSKSFNKTCVVNHFSCEIHENTVCGFLGPNGAGKTTTLRMLSGILEADSGSIEIFGEPVRVNKASTQLRYLQDVPEFYNYMSAYEYLKFICNLNKLVDVDKTIQETLELVGLHTDKNKKIGNFSRGMKQRMGIAANIIANPKVLLLDEPISALDPIGRREIFDLIAKLKGKMTIMFSTHIIQDIERVCDHIIVLNHGNKIIDTSLEDVKKKYVTDQIKIEFMTEAECLQFLGAYNTINHTHYTADGKVIQIEARNLNETQNMIFKLLESKQCMVQKFEIVAPSLEDIFMKEVSK